MSKTKFCPECGYTMDIDERLCPECGAEVENPAAAAPVANEPVGSVSPAGSEAPEARVFGTASRNNISGSVNTSTTNTNTNTIVIESLTPCLHQHWILNKLRHLAILREIGTDSDISIVQLLHNGQGLCCQHGVDTSNLVTYLPANLKEDVRIKFNFTHNYLIICCFYIQFCRKDTTIKSQNQVFIKIF